MEPITVSGQVTVRGNEPFSEFVLENGAGKPYVLLFEPGETERPRSMGYYEVTGMPFQQEWTGETTTHIRVTKWRERTNDPD